VKAESVISRDELESVVSEYHHVKEEHRRARSGSRVRRHLQARVEELARRFETLLEEAAVDDRERTRWRRHLQGLESEPSEPRARPFLLFRGRSDAGSTLEIHERDDGTLDAVVDGALTERLVGADDLHGSQPGLTFSVGGSVFRETFASPGEARAALVEAIADGAPPPRTYAPALLSDGLIDRNLGLTPRGRRGVELARRRSAVSG
jgi:hypothetical protein